MHLLAIDAGNTRIKWALHDGRQWLQRGYIGPDPSALLTSLAAQPDRIIISNVGGQANADRLAPLWPAERIHTIQASRVQCGVSNHYEQPEQLGSDRWAALIGAHKLGANTALVVTAGTALTVDALHQGQFLGGIIAPGYQLMQTALNRHTAQLGADSGTFQTFPRQTADAISSGCLLALSGAIEQMRTALYEQTQQTVTIWLNGGDAPILAPHFPLASRLEDNLVLTGLYFIAQEVYA